MRGRLLLLLFFVFILSSCSNEYTVTFDIFDKEDYGEYILLNSNETIASISLGNFHSSILTSTGRLYMWGLNESGQLGDNTGISTDKPIEITNNFNLYEDEKLSIVTLGSFYSTALTTSGRVFTWGSNNTGQLGDGTNLNRIIPIEITLNFNLEAKEKITLISTGFFHTAAVTSSGRVFTWGFNNSGQLGDGTDTDKNTPVEITSKFNLKNKEVISDVSLGSVHSVLLTSSGRVFTWGINDNGQLGNGTLVQSVVPFEINDRFNLSSDENIISITSGSNHSIVLTSKGRLFSWGWNRYGQLGNNTTNNKAAPSEFTAEIDFQVNETIKTIYSTKDHSVIETSNNRIFSWGRNTYGQIGNGATSNIFAPVEITDQFDFTEGEKITIFAISNHTLVLTSKGNLFVWGYNYFSQLGDRNNSNISTPTKLSLIDTPSFSETFAYKQNSLILEIETPLKKGYLFDGWYDIENPDVKYTFTTMPEKNITLFGRWVPIN